MINVSKIRKLTPPQYRFLQSEYVFYKLTFDKTKEKFPTKLFSEKFNGAKLLSCINLMEDRKYSYVFMFRKSDTPKIKILNLSYRQMYAGIGLSTSIFDFSRLNIAQQYQLLLGATLTADNNATGACYYVIEQKSSEVVSLRITFDTYEGYLMFHLPRIVTFRQKKEKSTNDKYMYYVSGFCVNKEVDGDTIEKDKLFYLPLKHDYSDKKKNTLPYHKLLFDDKFKSTKLYVLYFIGKKFEEFFNGHIIFPFPDNLFTVAEFMEVRSFTDAGWHNTLPRIRTELLEKSFCLNGKTIKFTDSVDSKESLELLPYLKDWCIKRGMKVTKSKAAYNIQLVHDEKYYKVHKGESDMYDKTHHQHITLETLRASVRTYKKETWDKTKLPPEIRTLFWEMIITDDILNHQCTTIGEHNDEIDVGINFYLKGIDGKEGIWHHGTLVIDKGNRMSFADATSLCNDMGSILLEVTERKDSSVIIIGIGKDIACIEETELFLIPDNYGELIEKYDGFKNRHFPTSAFELSQFVSYLTSASVKAEKREKLMAQFCDIQRNVEEKYPFEESLGVFELLSVIKDKSCRYHISRYLDSLGYGELFAHEREQSNLERYYGNMKGFVYGVGKMADCDEYYYTAPNGEGIGQSPFDKAFRIYHKWDIQGHVPMQDIMPYLTAGWYALDNTPWPCIKKYLEEWLRRKYKNEWNLY